jgi:hypothetical protein
MSRTLFVRTSSGTNVAVLTRLKSPGATARISGLGTVTPTAMEALLKNVKARQVTSTVAVVYAIVDAPAAFARVQGGVVRHDRSCR